MEMPPSLAPLRRLVPIQPRPLASTGVRFDAAIELRKALVVAAERDAKKRRHRVAVKRAYHAKQNTLGGLRAQEQTLEAQYELLLKQSRVAADASPQPDDEDDHAAASSLRELYLAILQVKRALERENAALREVAAHHEQFQARVRLAAAAGGFTAIDSYGDDDDDDALDKARGATRLTRSLSSVVKTPPPQPLVTAAPISLETCCGVIQEMVPRIARFMQTKSHFRLGSQVFGWTHKYLLLDPGDEAEDGGGFNNAAAAATATSPSGHLLQYSISKVFPSQRAFELSQRGWEIMTTQRHYQALHSSTMTSQIHLVQRVDNDNMVFLRILQRGGGQSIVFKTLLLASQFQVDKGVLTIYRSLDPSLILVDTSVDDKNAAWLEMFSWTYFEDQPEDGGSNSAVRFEFGGEMRHTTIDNARFWMMEVLLMALRWENLAVGPLFTLKA